MPCSVWPWCIICKVNSTNRGLHLKNTLCTIYLRGCDFIQSLSFFVISEWWPVHWCLNYRALLDLPGSKSLLEKVHLHKCLCWCVEGGGGSYFSLEVCVVGMALCLTVISDCTHPCDKNTSTHSLTRIHLLQLNIWMEFFFFFEITKFSI